MIDLEEILRKTREEYGRRKYGEDVFYKAPELYSISRQVESLAKVLVDELNKRLPSE